MSKPMTDDEYAARMRATWSTKTRDASCPRCAASDAAIAAIRAEIAELRKMLDELRRLSQPKQSAMSDPWTACGSQANAGIATVYYETDGGPVAHEIRVPKPISTHPDREDAMIRELDQRDPRDL